ncbi:MAG: helix-turn-helix transcriptional regulator [Clostridiaceae bacterium]|nr:helix-turn-helix transcriptional regulator [Clostridiaceae bacterium]
MKIDLEKLKELCMIRLLTQTELADKANISRATVSTIMYRGTCSKPTLFKLAKALDVEPVELLKVEG